MKKILLFTIIAVLISSVTITSISAQSQYDIPSWVKGVAGFWAEDKITDDEFGEGLAFLIDNEVIKVPKIQELENEISQLREENSQLRDQLNQPTPTPIPTPTPNPTSTVTIVPALGSENPGCEETPSGCFIPQHVTISVGETLKFINTDYVMHTFTSGNPTDGPDRIWPTVQGGIMPGDIFSLKFDDDEAGTYNYFCLVHPWMQGVIVVEGGLSTPEPEVTIAAKTAYSSYSSGDTVRVSGIVKPVVQNMPISMSVTSPVGELILLDQISPEYNGSFSTSFPAGGPLYTSYGEYDIVLNYGGAVKTQISFNFIKSGY